MLVGGAIVLAAGATYAYARHAATETIARHRATFERERADLSARPRGRPAILEPFAEGTAEEVAAKFDAAVAAVPKAERERLDADPLDGSSAAPPEERAQILDAHPEALLALAPILHVPSRVVFSGLDDVDAATAAASPRRTAAAKWAQAALRRAIERKEHARALRLVGELATLGADFDRRGSEFAWLNGERIERWALERLGDVLASGPLDVAEARSLARVLDALDARRPSLADISDFVRAQVRGVLSPQTTDIDEGLSNTGWRHLWSGKIFRAAALDEWDEVSGRLRKVVIESDADSRRAIEAADRLDRGTQNVLVRLGLVGWTIGLRSRATLAGTWRVGRASLAVAIHAAEAGTAPASLEVLVPSYLSRVPIDPWDGKPLRYSAGPPARVWSVGPDGKDHGGAPLTDQDDDYESHGDDVVITIPPAR